MEKKFTAYFIKRYENSSKNSLGIVLLLYQLVGFSSICLDI
jgi:hypothetical protein